jgi:hypothetical protein
MFDLFLSLLGALLSAFRTQADLALENLALRQQLANLQRTSGRPRLRKSDRAFWLVLSRLWSRWADVLVVVKPDTVVRWHRAGFRLFWRWKSRSRSPAEGDVSAEVKTLIRQMADANVGWGAATPMDIMHARIHAMDAAPTASEVNRIYMHSATPDPAVWADWPLFGGNPADVAGHGRDLTMNGAVAPGVLGPPQLP